MENNILDEILERKSIYCSLYHLKVLNEHEKEYLTNRAMEITAKIIESIAKQLKSHAHTRLGLIMGFKDLDDNWVHDLRFLSKTLTEIVRDIT